MDATSLGALVVLALVDSTSFGTLLIPVWLLAAPGRVRVRRVLIFLLAVVFAYFLIGIALLMGAATLVDSLSGFQDTDAFLMGQFAVGIALLAVSFLMDNKTTRARAAARVAAGEGRVSRWRKKAMADDGAATAGSTATLLALAVTAVLAEVATMLPYLAAIGIITAEGPGGTGNAGLLAGYCLVMIAPALVLLVGRVVARSALEGPLSRLDKWLTKNAQSTTAWIIGIVGVLLALNAAGELGWWGS